MILKERPLRGIPNRSMVMSEKELGLSDDITTGMTRVSVFMNVFDVHVNRAPVDGRVERIAYRPRKFLNASLDKASDDNERNALAIEMADGRKLGVVLGSAADEMFDLGSELGGGLSGSGGLDVAIEAVVGDVDRAAREPLVGGGGAVVEHAIPRGRPAQRPRL